MLAAQVEKFGPSPRVLNLLAVCQIHGKNYTQAFGYLKQARELVSAFGNGVA